MNWFDWILFGEYQLKPTENCLANIKNWSKKVTSKDDGKILDLNNSRRVVQYIGRRKAWGGGEDGERFGVEKQQFSGDI